MLLEDAIKQHKRVLDLLDDMSGPTKDKKQEDDYMVRPYLVRAHWRRRPTRKRKLVLRPIQGGNR